MFDVFLYLMLLCILLVSSISDVKTKLLPIRAMILFTVIFSVIGFLYAPEGLFVHLMSLFFGGAYGFFVFFIMAKYFGGGGGDAVYMGCVGLLMGFRVLPIIILSSLCYLAYRALLKKKKEKGEIAYIPCVFAAMVIYLPMYLYF